jgi:hypothetical protein
MTRLGKRIVTTIILAASSYGITTLAPRLVAAIVTPVVASPAGDACRKEICDATVAACMRADLSLNPLARMEVEKKDYCAGFFPGCMSRSITPDFAWYSPETVARFMKCPS